MLTKMFILAGILGLASTAGCDEKQAAASSAGDSETTVVKGERAYAQTCAACHGFNAHGMPNQGANLKLSPFVASHSDDQIVELIKSGRQPTDANSTMKLLMPPNGGNPTLSDAQLHQIVAYLRQVQHEAGVAQTAGVSRAQ